MFPPGTHDVVPSGRKVAHPRDLMNLSSGQQGAILVIRDVSAGEFLSGSGMTEASATASILSGSRDRIESEANRLVHFEGPAVPSDPNQLSVCGSFDHVISVAEEEFLRVTYLSWRTPLIVVFIDGKFYLYLGAHPAAHREAKAGHLEDAGPHAPYDAAGTDVEFEKPCPIVTVYVDPDDACRLVSTQFLEQHFAIYGNGARGENRTR